ncbi:hypothetical protein AB4072_12220 [Microvirga sp. 2MCAF38]|uniref:hypothetical protein n=1 Tax=Microvirga sp. 2MCAF38 TaxID=3232989 RepID=UPI003F9799FA
MDYFSIPISLVSLTVSLGTFWLAFVDRGRLRMTKPTIVFFGFDTVPKPTPKVFLRTLLYSTATRGQIIEGMYATVRHCGRERVFRFWGYGENNKLSPGSGLQISRTGLAANHHFVLSVHEDAYVFEPGAYEIGVNSDVVGRRKPMKLGTIKLVLSDEHAAALARQEGVLFERKIDGEYEGHSRGKNDAQHRNSGAPQANPEPINTDDTGRSTAASAGLRCRTPE